jgi:threonine/homoserine/homoserine lactone efflux protein
MLEQVHSLFGGWRPFLTLVVAAMVVMGSPGPATLSVTAVGAAFGFRRSLRYLAGIVLGTTAVLLAVASGVVAMLLAAPELAPALLVASAAYILYLAFRIATAPPLAERSQAMSAPAFLGGFLLAIANPKAYVAIAAVFAGTTLVPEAHALDAMLKIVVLSAMIILIHLAWLSAGAGFSRILYDPVRSRIANILFAATLLATTVLAFVK